jgi:hypothetical protein
MVEIRVGKRCPFPDILHEFWLAFDVGQRWQLVAEPGTDRPHARFEKCSSHLPFGRPFLLGNPLKSTVAEVDQISLVNHLVAYAQAIRLASRARRDGPLPC